MTKEKKPVHKIRILERKRNIIHQLLKRYDIQTAKDILDVLKYLFGNTIKKNRNRNGH